MDYGIDTAREKAENERDQCVMQLDFLKKIAVAQEQLINELRRL